MSDYQPSVNSIFVNHTVTSPPVSRGAQFEELANEFARSNQSSPSSEKSAGKVQKIAASANSFRRSYKACLNCRLRKVKCDLGDLSNPFKPPCVRCRREGKECQFAESRRGGVSNVRAGKEKRSSSVGLSPPDSKFKDKYSTDDPIAGRELHNTSDALEILAHAARSFPKISGKSPASKRGTAVNSALNEKLQLQSSASSVLNSPILQKLTLADSDIVSKENIVTEDEASRLIQFFFDTLHPFYPFIPDELHTIEALVQMPLLLAAVATAASRYCNPVKKGDHNRSSEEIHNKLWTYCQRLVSSTVWAEASTRSIGSCYAFLIFSEWNPKAVHQRWQDYANSIPRSGGQQDQSGLGASRRSDRMSWLLIGNSIRLAQDLGVMETSPKIFLANHLSEIVLSLRMGRPSMLGHSLNEPIPEGLEFTDFERAKLGLLQIMSLAHETLYSSRITTRELLKNGSYLTFLALFGPQLDNWERSFRGLLKNPSLERESILFDYHYTRLYIYSLALRSTTNADEGGNVAEVIPASRYVGMAMDAAKEVLAVANRVHQMELLSVAPIRWVVRIVHAAVFLVKSIMLSSTMSISLHRHSISMVKKTAAVLLESSPDNVHLSSRYATILSKLCTQLTEKIKQQEVEMQIAAQKEMERERERDKFNPPPSSPLQSPRSQQSSASDGTFEFSRYSVRNESELESPPLVENSQRNEFLSSAQIPDEQSQQVYDNTVSLLSVLNMDFDFLMEGTEGLGFVDPLMEGIEQHQIMQQQDEQQP